MLSIGALIWISLRPLLRLLLCVSFGIAITKADIFPVVASRGAGQVILNILGPCLMFSKIVPAFSTDNIGTLGPLFLVAFLYEGIGLALAWVIQQFFWVPHRFRYGILVAGGWGNWGDIPTSVVMSIMGGPPFNSAADQTLAVAYISAFILVFYISFFPMGASRLIAWDYTGPDVEDDEVREAIRRRRSTILRYWVSAMRLIMRHEKTQETRSVSPDLEKDEQVFVEHVPAGVRLDTALNDRSLRGSHTNPADKAVTLPSPQISHQIVSQFRSAATADLSVSPNASAAPTVVQVDSSSAEDACSKSLRSSESPSAAGTRADEPRTRGRRFKTAARNFLIQLLSPPSLSIILSFVISLINPIKALFIEIPNFHVANAPDGQPPLAFVMDTATFVGAASVPLGLICLGSALARLKIPMNMNAWKVFPVGAISVFALVKIVLSPILGVLICQGLTHVGVIDPNDKVLRFVCIFFSCLPTATMQVYVTQVYSPTGTAEHVSAFLVPQYALLIIVMPVLTAYSLNLLS